MIGVETAGVRQDPYDRPGKACFLGSKPRARPIERKPIRSDPDNGHVTGTISLHISLEADAPRPELLPVELVSRHGRASHKIRDAATVRDEFPLF